MFNSNTGLNIMLAPNYFAQGCRMHLLHLCRGVRPPPHSNECLGYDTEQSDSKVPVILELQGMQSSPSLPLLLGSLGPGVGAPNKGPIYGSNRTKPWFQELTVFLHFELCIYAKLNGLK